jgi:hypothetical protein
MKFSMKWKPLTVLVALLVLIGTLYFITRNPIVEGLANPSHTEFVAKGIKNDITSLEDSFLLSKYQSNYREIVNDLMKWCDLQILQVLVANKINIKDGIDPANTELITSLNQYSQFKNTLQGVYDSVLTNVQAKQ